MTDQPTPAPRLADHPSKLAAEAKPDTVYAGPWISAFARDRIVARGAR